MKQRLTGFLALLLAACGGLAVGLYSGRAAQGEAPLQAVEPAQGVSIGASQAKPRYRLAGKDGKLAVYIIGKAEPELIFDIYLHHLPDVDRMQLEQGIDVEDYQQLLRMIEDYTS